MEKLVNITVDEFKKVEGVDSVQIIDHPDFKLFAAAGNGKRFKSQGNLDVTKPVEFLYTAQVDETTGEMTHTDEQWNAGCFVNPNEANVILSL